MKRHHGMFLALAFVAAGCAQQAEEAADKAKAAADQVTATSKKLESDMKKSTEEITSSANKTKEALEAAAEELKGKAGELKEKASDALGALGGEFGEALTKATDALKNVEGGSEIATGLGTLFKDAQSALGDITSGEAAQAAVDKLSALAPSVEGLSEKLKALPAEAKTAIAVVIEKGVAQLKTLVDKVKGLDGVSDTVKTKLDEFLTKVETLKS